jgi:hypothetical protein
MCLPLDAPDAFLAPGLAMLGIVPALCVVPAMLQATRQPFAAVVFSLTLVAMMKLAGCIVVVLVHGWDASEQGHTDMPWTHPNLLVISFLLATVLLSAVCLTCGFKGAGTKIGATIKGVEA